MIVSASRPVVESGVYRISSLVAGNANLAAADTILDDDSETAIPEAKLATMKASSDDNAIAVDQLWRVQHLQNGYYTVRPYNHRASALCAASTAVQTQYLGLSDDWDLVSSEYLWKIEAQPIPGGGYGNCFSLQLYGSAWRLENSANLSSPDTSDDYVTVFEDYGGAEHRWIFEEISQPPAMLRFYSIETGSYMGTPLRYIPVNSEKSLSELGVIAYVAAMEYVDPFGPCCIWSGTDVVVNSQKFCGVTVADFVRVAVTVNILDHSLVESDIFFFVEPVSEGITYFKNPQSGSYMDVLSSTVTSNVTAIYQRAYHGQESQRWEIRMVDYENGYYTIGKTVNDNIYHLGLVNNTPADGAGIVLRSGQIVDGMLWQIEKMPSGNFKIKSKLQIPGSAQELVMAVSWSGTNQSADGLQIKALLYSDDNYNTDEWNLNRNILRINVLADYGYVERFGEEAYLNRIHECMQRAQSYYFANFGVTIVYDTVELIQSYADQCSDNNYNTICECSGLSCEHHHTNATSIMSSIENPDLAETTVLLFSGHKLCTTDNNGKHDIYGVYGISWSSLGKAIIVNFEDDQRKEVKTVVHEINHWYGVEDHYDDKANDGDNVFTTDEINDHYNVNYYQKSCIHGEGKEDEEVYSPLVTCEGCVRKVRANASRFQHE